METYSSLGNVNIVPFSGNIKCIKNRNIKCIGKVLEQYMAVILLVAHQEVVAFITINHYLHQKL